MVGDKIKENFFISRIQKPIELRAQAHSHTYKYQYNKEYIYIYINCQSVSLLLFFPLHSNIDSIYIYTIYIWVLVLRIKTTFLLIFFGFKLIFIQNCLTPTQLSAFKGDIHKLIKVKLLDKTGSHDSHPEDVRHQETEAKR